MNRALLGRIGSFLFAFYVLGFGVLFLWVFLGFGARAVLPSLRWMYSLERAFSLFMQYLLPIHTAAIAVAASLSGGRAAGRGTPAEPFARVASSTLVMFLLLSIAYTLAFEIGYPAVTRAIGDMEYSSNLARQLTEEAKTAQRAGDYRGALELVNRALQINRNDAGLVQMRVTLESRVARMQTPAPAPVAAGNPQLANTQGAQTLVEKAKYYAARGDWFSAHFYAQRAAARDPRRTDAVQLAAQAAEQLARLSEAQSDSAAREAYEAKKRAYLELAGGNPFAAYYSFQALAKKYPGDTDVATYLAEATAQVARQSFFIDEARRVEQMPGPERILFFNSRDPAALEAVAIGKMVQVREGTYFVDVEAVHYDSAGRVAWHLSAPYGKLVHTVVNGEPRETILLRAIDAGRPSMQLVPRYTAGTRPEEQRNILPVKPSADEMRFLTTSSNALADMGPVDLWRVRDSLPGRGRSAAALSVDLMMKLVMPFAFLILSLFALAFGWAFRARGTGRLGGFAAILTPLVPAGFAVLSLLYLFAHRVVLGFAALALGLTPALIVGAALEFVLLVTAFVVLAGQSGS